MHFNSQTYYVSYTDSRWSNLVKLSENASPENVIEITFFACSAIDVWSKIRTQSLNFTCHPCCEIFTAIRFADENNKWGYFILIAPHL